MDFELTEEQAMLRDVSRAMLSAHCPPTLVRDLGEAQRDLDEKLWRRAADLGWPGLVVPEDAGGADQGLVELCVVSEEIGRSIAPGPFVETALIARALATSTSPDADLLDGLIEGRLTAAWAHDGHVAGRVVDGVLVLTGAATAVHAAAATDLLMVTVHTDDGTILVLVDTSATRLRRLHTIDETRASYEVAFDALSVPAERVVATEKARVRWYLDAALVLVAADALGAGEAMLEMTVRHAGVREQFGRPLGAFQSVKLKAADMLAVLRSARAAIYHAAMILDAGAEGASVAAIVAKAYTGEEVGRIGGEALQTHGGIGFTWEHDLHLFLRRARADQVLHGTTAELQDRLVTLLA